VSLAFAAANAATRLRPHSLGYQIFNFFSKLHAEKSEEDSDMSDPVQNPVRTRILILDPHSLGYDRQELFILDT